MANETPIPANGFIMSEPLYLKMKFVALVLLPAISTLYFTLGAVWDLPHVTQVIGTIAAIDTFLGVMLGLSTKAYNASEQKYAGSINVQETPNGGKLFSLELNGAPADIEVMKEVIFKVESKK
jgi:hypothetical protein